MMDRGERSISILIRQDQLHGHAVIPRLGISIGDLWASESD